MTNSIRTTILIITILVPLPGNAQEANSTKPILIESILEIGKRQDQLNWNIAGDLAGENPNILSELTWKDLEIFQIKTGGRLTLAKNNWFIKPCLRGRIDYGWITDGENQDSDYNGDNRTQEFSRSNNRSEDGSVFDASLGAGVHFKPIPRANLFITPLIGIAYNKQNLKITEGYQTIPLTGPISGLNSTYEAKWYGSWLGADLEWQVIPTFSILGAIEFHQARYEAVANWNLRSDLNHPVSFKHKAENATGYLLGAGARYSLHKNVSTHVDVNFQKWQLDDEDARHTMYLNTGTSSKTRLNEVNWESLAVMLGVTVLLP